MNSKSHSTDSTLVPGLGRIPFPAYHGDEPYIFISYAHADNTRVFPLIKDFYDSGYHVWYDEGIAPGNEWTADIAKALKGCTLFVVMISPQSVASANCKNEINFALKKNIPIIAIHLEKTVLPDDLELQIGTKQAILKYTMTREEYVYKYTDAFARFNLLHGNIIPEKEIRNTNTFFKPFLIVSVIILLMGFVYIITLKNNPPSAEEEKEEYRQYEVSDQTGEEESQQQESQQEESQQNESQQDESQQDEVSDQTGQDNNTSENTPSNAQKEVNYTYDDTNDSEGADFYLYERKYNGINLTKYFGNSDSEVIVPEIIDGYPVTVIGEKCFEDHTEIEKVVLPETVISIRYNAFNGCIKLSSINIPESLQTLGGWCFASTAITEFICPAGFKTLEYGAFHNCSNLEKVVLTEAISFIDRDTFRGCSKLTNVTIPSKDIDIDIKGFDEKSKNLTIYGVKGSYAEKYATAMGFSFEEYVIK